MMGYYAIYALTAAANGEELEDVPTDGYWYDSTNMDDEEIAPNLYD
jgi:ribose transport system substrate-binding protein